MTFERSLYDPAYFENLHPRHWFKSPSRKYEERNRDVLRLVQPSANDRVVELGSARGDISFLLAAYARDVVGVDAAAEAVEMAGRECARRGLANVRFVEADVADLSPLSDGSADAVAAIDLVEHIDDLTLSGMLSECRRILAQGGRLALYTPDRAHWIERLKAHDLLLKQFPQHIAVRRREAYEAVLVRAGFAVEISTYSVCPFPLVRWVERALAPLPLVGATFRYRILIRARRVGGPS